MPLHIQIGCCQQLCEQVTLVEGGRFLYFVYKRLRHWLPGLVVGSIALKHLRLCSPMLIELRGELHKVARGGAAGKHGVLLVGKDTMQPMPELVEHGSYVAEA